MPVLWHQGLGPGGRRGADPKAALVSTLCPWWLSGGWKAWVPTEEPAAGTDLSRDNAEPYKSSPSRPRTGSLENIPPGVQLAKEVLLSWQVALLPRCQATQGGWQACGHGTI